MEQGPIRQWKAALLTLAVTAWVSSITGATPAQKASAEEAGEKPAEALARQVRHQLLVLPFFSVFDNLAFTMEGDKVTLSGQVVRPTLKAHAEAAVKSLEGVGTVVNQIEVLPVSPTDNEIRRATYQAIYRDRTLKKYAVLAVPPIHIIVKNGALSLEGEVETESDRGLAESRAGSVANVSGVTNHLSVRKKEKGAK